MNLVEDCQAGDLATCVAAYCNSIVVTENCLYFDIYHHITENVYLVLYTYLQNYPIDAFVVCVHCVYLDVARKRCC